MLGSCTVVLDCGVLYWVVWVKLIDVTIYFNKSNDHESNDHDRIV